MDRPRRRPHRQVRGTSLWPLLIFSRRRTVNVRKYAFDFNSGCLKTKGEASPSTSPAFAPIRLLFLTLRALWFPRGAGSAPDLRLGSRETKSSSWIECLVRDGSPYIPRTVKQPACACVFPRKHRSLGTWQERSENGRRSRSLHANRCGVLKRAACGSGRSPIPLENAAREQRRATPSDQHSGCLCSGGSEHSQ